jgi:hypothetical protein
MYRVLFLSIVFFARPVCAESLDGWWLSNGYGMLLHVDSDNVSAFELTSISCFPSWHAMRKADAGGKDDFRFTRGPGVQQLTLDSVPSAMRLHADCASADILWRRLSQPPQSYAAKLENTPQVNYAVFWQTFAENYPFFELRRVNWEEVDREFRPQVTSKTSAEELFRILRKMIEPLRDAHTSLSAPSLKRQYRGSRPEPNQLQFEDWKRNAEIVTTKYVRGSVQYFCKYQLGFGMLDDSIGYLKIWSFDNYTDEPEYEKQLQALEAALDTIFHDSKQLRGLVIDVRMNTGGYDGLGISIASRLAPEEYLAYSVKTRDDGPGKLRFTPSQPVPVRTSVRPSFQGNVVLLIGHDCVSAGETFAMSLLGRKPTVTRIGENTQGVYSDVLTRQLPNGWSFGLPTDVYLTEDGKSFDGVGVPPDIAMPVLPREDLKQGRDLALQKAVDILRNVQQ